MLKKIMKKVVSVVAMVLMLRLAQVQELQVRSGI